MYLRKIVDWISNNHQDLKSNKETNERTFEEPKATISRNINVDNGVLSTSSLGNETSVLDFSFLPQNNSVDNMPCDSQANKNVRVNGNQDSCVTLLDIASKQLELKHSENDFSPNESKEIVPDEDSQTTEIIPIDDQTCGIDADLRTGSCEHITKPSFLSSSSSTTCISPFSNPSNFKRYTPDAKCRDFWTQSEAKADKRRHSSIWECSRKHDFSKNFPEHQPKARPSSAPNASRPNCKHVSWFSESKKSEVTSELTVYGAFYVFGCNRAVPDHLVEKMSTKYVLRKRREANGIREAFSCVRSISEALLCLSPSKSKHAISYQLSGDRSVVVAFKHDSLSDMFQIGRHETHPVDFTVVDTNPSEKARNGVSRFACRVLVSREGTHEARVYAAAFDSSGTIFMGDNGIASSYSGKMDGFTTNGVLVMHPGRGWPGIWREVSVSGYIYPLRTTEMECSKRPRILQESNVLQDGTMIDLCGVTLLWRTPEGLKKVPNEQFLSCLQSTLHRSVPECGLLRQPSKFQVYGTKRATKKAYVYISCGHVVGLTLAEPPDNLQGWPCPDCRGISPIIELKIGAEPGFYVDREFPSHAFKPCGHAASFKTVEYWSSTVIPNHRSIEGNFCPFCGVKLNFINQYVELILPTVKRDVH